MSVPTETSSGVIVMAANSAFSLPEAVPTTAHCQLVTLVFILPGRQVAIGWLGRSLRDEVHVTHGDCVALDAVGGGYGHRSNVRVEVLSV